MDLFPNEMKQKLTVPKDAVPKDKARQHRSSPVEVRHKILRGGIVSKLAQKIFKGR